MEEVAEPNSASMRPLRHEPLAAIRAEEARLTQERGKGLESQRGRAGEPRRLKQ